MAQIPLGALTTLNLSTQLDPMFTELYAGVTVADGAFAQKWKAATGNVRLRPYIDPTYGGLLESYNAAETALQPITIAGSTVRLIASNVLGLWVDSSANVLVNTLALGSSNANGATFEPYAGGIKSTLGHNTGAAGGDAYASYLRNGVTLGSITQVSLTGVLYNTTSDERLKTNIVDLPDQGSLIDLIHPREFEFVSDPGVVVTGFIAQELHKHVPHAVLVGGDNAQVSPWAVDASRLVPMMLKELQSLRARVAALGG